MGDRRDEDEDEASKLSTPLVQMKNPRTSSLLITLLSTLSYLPDRVLVLGKAVRARAPTAAPTYVGGSTVAVYPPPSVTVDTSVFPDESHLGFTGPTPSTSSSSLFLPRLTASVLYDL